MNTHRPDIRSVLGRVKASYPRIQHLLVPLDFSGKSRQALRYAVPLAQKFSAKVHLVHVLRPGRKADRMDLPRRQEEAWRRLVAMAARLLPPRLPTGNLVLTGEPARQILAAAAKLDADLIVLTTKGHGGLKRMLLGSTAEYVMRHAPCPVVSIRRR
ncbi:MAG: hypothetical protein A3G75_10930 [Verrucomicrobia bacterium RIFCSPLOWO2_12_FULL_64_8]|nr:MAG: hypothetical protein A3G75_10930 [Verrucomicrobia bacterium RIFCSPLOWO2_12_FULL_64_8]